MWPRSLTLLLAPALLLALAGCPGGAAGLGESCDSHDACDSRYQCVASVCVQRCQRGPECGDGYACTAGGLCELATGQAGDACESETDCAPGLACGIDRTLPDGITVISTCTAHRSARPSGSPCEVDGQCRNNTCALGTCVDLCRETRDCIAGAGCTGIPLVDNSTSPATVGGTFNGCLPSRGSIVWSIPVNAPKAEIALPVPESARSAAVVFSVSDPAQRVGASWVKEPGASDPVYTKPCDPQGPTDPTCNPTLALDQYYRQPMRHLPAPGQSVLQIPSSERPLLLGAYRLEASSFRPNGATGSAIPRVTAVVKMDDAVNLDLHFHFLDLDDHPCDGAYAGANLSASIAENAAYFQTDYLAELRRIFASGGIVLNHTTYTDVRDHPELDGLAREDVGALLSLGEHTSGLDVFFVRTMSPVGLQAFGPNPGPAGLPGTQDSGIVISIDTLCYRTWPQLARRTAHQVARYMGLYHNVELEVENHPEWRDHTDSDDSSSNLMYFSENGGSVLSEGQSQILTKSAVLR